MTEVKKKPFTIIDPVFIKEPLVKVRRIDTSYADDIEWAGKTSSGKPLLEGEKAEQFCKKILVNKGHESLGRFAFAKFRLHHTLITEKQLLRHKFFDWCIKSLRYTLQAPVFMTSPGIIAHGKEEEKQHRQDCVISYNHYLQALNRGLKKEDAREKLPLCCVTTSSLVANFQALRDFLKLRLSDPAEWEIKHLAVQMGEILLENAYSCFCDLQDTILEHKEKLQSLGLSFSVESFMLLDEAKSFTV